MRKSIIVIISLFAFLGILALVKFRSYKTNSQPIQTITQIAKTKSLQISSLVFESQSFIPKRYTCDGSNINPPLIFSNITQGVKTLVLIIDDPDAPLGTFDHWVVFNIDPSEKVINEGKAPLTAKEGLNGSGKIGYIGPCPPSGTHHYHFKLYAIDLQLNFNIIPTKSQIEKAIQGHILDQADMIGLYQRS